MNSFVLVGLAIFQIGWSAGLALIPCELGERLTGAFGGICDEIENFNWYAFPIKVQRMLPVILIDAQEPVVLKCFGSISCVRDVFKRVSKMQIITQFELS